MGTSITTLSGIAPAQMATMPAAAPVVHSPVQPVAGGPADTFDLASIQQAIAGLAALLPALTAIAGGGPSVLTGAAGAPNRTTMPNVVKPAGTGKNHGKHATGSMPGMPGMPASGSGPVKTADDGKFGNVKTMKMSGKMRMHGMHMEGRTTSDKPERAKQVYSATMEFFGTMTRKSVPHTKRNGNHYHLTTKVKKAFHKQYPGLPVPSSVMMPQGTKGSDKPIGVVWSGKKFVNLGLGTNHMHPGKTNYMQHVWFTDPKDLGFAFADEAVKPQAIKRANKYMGNRA